jgi:S-adenosylmethionine:tRNA ribosyltransferase-isomerase
MSELDQYDYHLPPGLIAQYPLPNRADARLLVVDRQTQSLEHRHVRDLPELLRPADCLVVNDTRVVPARLIGYRKRTGGRWEGLFLEVGERGLWRVMGKTRGRPTTGETIVLLNAAGMDDIELEIAGRMPDGSWLLQPRSSEEVYALLERVGRVPLPPYIRKGRMVPDDRQRYQTIYARQPGAVAAPTAGLHFTDALFNRLIDHGVTVCRVTLHVGEGTFQPVKTATLAEHPMHYEWGAIEPTAIETIARCQAAGGRVVAVGTTSVRVLETAAAGGRLEPFRGQTNLFIRPPYRFRVVEAMLTNFHLPRSTLLVLVRTFGGDELIRRAYDVAVAERYRFYSYGDAMLIL